MSTCTASFDGEVSRCPADFDRYQYARGIQLERVRAAVTVSAAVFSPCGEYLVCASDSGRLAVWELAPYMEKEAFAGGDTPDTTPGLSFRADDSCINSLSFAGNILLCGGDESLFGWPWADVVAALKEGVAPPPGSSSSSSSSSSGSRLLRVRCPQSTGRRGARLPSPEINDVSFDETTGRIVCAAGDGNAYEWDLGVLSSSAAFSGTDTRGAGGGTEGSGLVRTYEGGRGYLHAVAGADGSSLMATGSDDGYIGLWDRRSKSGADGANVTFLRPMHPSTGGGGGKEASPGRREAGGGAGNGGDCVTSLEMDEGGNTLVCAGRREWGGGGGGAKVLRGMSAGGARGVGGEEASGGRGWVNHWSMAALTATSMAQLPAEVQCMAAAEDGQTLLVAGAEPSVTYLTRSRLETRARTPASPSSVYALAVHGFGRHEGITCIAGVGPKVDIYTLPGIVAFSLCFL